MPYFVVALEEEAELVRQIIEAKYPENHWKLNNSTFFLYFAKKQKASEIAKVVNIENGPHTGFVLHVDSWMGFINKEFGEWRKKQEAGG